MRYKCKSCLSPSELEPAALVNIGASMVVGAKIITGLLCSVKAVQATVLVSTPFSHIERRPRTVSRSFPRI
jgi:hypothetical protein